MGSNLGPSRTRNESKEEDARKEEESSNLEEGEESGGVNRNVPPQHLEQGQLGLARRADTPRLRGMRGKEDLVWDLGIRVWGSEFRVWRLAFRVWGLGFGSWGFWGMGLVFGV